MAYNVFLDDNVYDTIDHFIEFFHDNTPHVKWQCIMEKPIIPEGIWQKKWF